MQITVPNYSTINGSPVVIAALLQEAGLFTVYFADKKASSSEAEKALLDLAAKGLIKIDE